MTVLEGSEILTVGELARLLNVHPNTLRRLAKKGEIKSFRRGKGGGGGQLWFRRADIEAFLEKCEN